MGSMHKEDNPTDSPKEDMREDSEAEMMALMELHGNSTHFGGGARERMLQSEIRINPEVEIACMNEYMEQMLEFYDSPYEWSSHQVELDMSMEEYKAMKAKREMPPKKEDEAMKEKTEMAIMKEDMGIEEKTEMKAMKEDKEMEEKKEMHLEGMAMIVKEEDMTKDAPMTGTTTGEGTMTGQTQMMLKTMREEIVRGQPTKVLPPEVK